MKRRWLIVSLLAAVFAIGTAGGAVLAQEAPPEGGSHIQSFAARLAAILGLEEQVVQDAVLQAKTEMRDEGLKRKLDMLVEKGRLTQEQADEYLQWDKSRPAFLAQGSRIHGPRGFGFHRGKARGGRGFFGPHGIGPAPAEAPPPADGVTS